MKVSTVPPLVTLATVSFLSVATTASADGVFAPYVPDGVTDARQCSWFAPASGGWVSMPFTSIGHKEQWDVVLEAHMSGTTNFYFNTLAYDDGRTCDPVASSVYIWGR